jgi:hypothetical protein
MKKELFTRIVAIATEAKPVHKHVVKEHFETYCFLINDRSHIGTKIKEGIKAKMNHEDINGLIHGASALSVYLNITYDKRDDKISVSYFEAGWNWGHNKRRFFPMTRSKPLVCYSKNFYVFNRHNNKPRLMTTMSASLHGGTIYKIMMALTGIELASEEHFRINVPIKYAIGTKDHWEIIKNRTGVTVPKALRVFEPQEILDLISILRNPNELSSICAYLAKTKADPTAVRDPHTSNMIYDNTLSLTLCKMMFGENNGRVWLIRDYMRDLVQLKRKMSLKMKSVARMEDEHRKMTRELMLKGIKAITVSKPYVEMYEKAFANTNVELISDKNRLMQESYEQDHCVATYASKINRGECCILSLIQEDKRWTVEIGKSNHFVPSLVILQVRGHRNSNPPESVREFLNDKLKLVGTLGFQEEQMMNL